MPTVNPINLSKWQPNTPILSAEARQEFMNIYNLVNGELDASNLADGAVTTEKLQDGAVTGAKIDSIPASKINGQLAEGNLPSNILNSAGGTVTGTLTYDVPAGTALLKNYDNEEIVLYEGGTGVDKIQLIVGGAYAFRTVKNGVILFAVKHDGTVEPKQLKIPVV